jgi:site-specific recombinase XerD
LLKIKGFTTSINKLFDKFCKFYNAEYNKHYKFSTHSGRIGFVTSLTKAGVPVDVVSKIVGHKSISSTQKYAKYQLDDRTKIDYLNKAVQTEQDKNKN